MKAQRRDPIIVLLLSIVTCGIYYLYWIYATTKDLGTYLNDDSNPGMDLLLSIFCTPYTIYWMYKTGKQVAIAEERAGIRSEDNSILYLVLSIFGFGVVAALIMQSAINKVWES